MAGVGYHQQLAAGLERASLLGGVGALDAGPRLQQADRRGAGLLAHGDEEALLRLGVDDHALVHQRVLLERALEVVAERGVGAGREHVPVVGLHEGAVADLVVLDLGADSHDPSAGLVAGHGGLSRRARSWGWRPARRRCRKVSTSPLRGCAVKACSSLVSLKQMPVASILHRIWVGPSSGTGLLGVEHASRPRPRTGPRTGSGGSRS